MYEDKFYNGGEVSCKDRTEFLTIVSSGVDRPWVVSLGLRANIDRDCKRAVRKKPPPSSPCRLKGGGNVLDSRQFPRCVQLESEGEVTAALALWWSPNWERKVPRFVFCTCALKWDMRPITQRKVFHILACLRIEVNSNISPLRMRGHRCSIVGLFYDSVSCETFLHGIWVVWTRNWR